MKHIEIIMDFLEQNKIQILSTTYENKPISRPIGSAYDKATRKSCKNRKAKA